MGLGVCGAGGDWPPGLPWQDCLATAVLAVKGNTGCQSQTRVDLRGGQHGGVTTCVHFSPSASVLERAGWQHPWKSYHQPTSMPQLPGSSPVGAPMIQPSRKSRISHPQPCLGQDAARPPLVPLLEKSNKYGDWNSSGAAGCTQHCPCLVCCWPWALLHAVSAQVPSERQPRESKSWAHPVLLRLDTWPGRQVWLQRSKTHMC